MLEKSSALCTRSSDLTGSWHCLHFQDSIVAPHLLQASFCTEDHRDGEQVVFFLKASYTMPARRDNTVLIAAGLGYTVWVQREPRLPQAGASELKFCSDVQWCLHSAAQWLLGIIPIHANLDMRNDRAMVAWCFAMRSCFPVWEEYGINALVLLSAMS